MNRIVLLLCVLLLVSCSESLDIQLDPEVSVFIQGEHEKVIRLGAQDKEHVALDNWLREHRSDWHATSGRYSGGIYIKSGSHGIQVTQTHVVLYSTTAVEPKAIYIQKLAGGELAELKKIAQ